MSFKVLSYLTASAIVLSSACDASVFDASALKHQDAGVDASTVDAGSGGSSGSGGAGGTATGMSMLPAGGAGGSAGTAGKAGNMGSAGKAGSAGMAGAAGSKAACNLSCSAEHAKGMCKDNKCVFTCETGTADCNGDVDKADGDGCESVLAEDIDNCGACANRCRAADGALAQCAASKCQTVSLIDEPGQMLMSHGTPIDSVTTQLCHAGSVLTGIEGFVVDSLIADSIRIICSPLTLSGNGDAPTITVGKAYVPVAEFAGGINRQNNSMNQMPAPYKLSCGAGEVVRQVRVTVWAHWGDANGQRYDTIKDFALACAKPDIKDGKVVFAAPGELKVTTATMQQDASPQRDENDMCGDNEAFLGFNIGFGTNVDHIVSLCSNLSVATVAVAP